jgi:c-di-GMP-binding flagellar brake protein YcgR
MDTDNGAERRRQPRITLKQLAQAMGRDLETGEPSEVMGTTADLSEGGVRFEAERGFKEGSQVSISFSVGEEIIEAVGQVVHFTPREDGVVSMGLKFVDLSESDQRFIENFCRTRSD